MKLALLAAILTSAFVNAATAGSSPLPLRIFSGGSDLDTAAYFLGWSKNGSQIALLNAQPWEASDWREWKIDLINLKNDEIVFSKVINPEGPGESSENSDNPSSPPVDEIVAIWAAHGPAIEAICVKQGVTRAEAEVHRFPALPGRHRGDIYDVRQTSTVKEEPDFGYRAVQRLKVEITRNQSESKTILDKTWKEYYPLAAAVIGYIPNPDGNRIAVIIGFVERGYEGAPHPRFFMIVGSRIGDDF